MNNIVSRNENHDPMVLPNVIGRCECHDIVDAVPLFEHTLCVNSLLVVNVTALIIFQQAIERNEFKYKK